MADIVDRLETVTRRFPEAAFVGAAPFLGLLTPACGVGWIVAADAANERLAAERPAVVLDEERLPFAPGSLDLFVSLLTLHAVNDLVGALVQLRVALKPGGLFLAALFGEETLSRFRAALYRAESEIIGGVSPRFAPFATVRDLGAALQRAGFSLPVVDVDTTRVAYSDAGRLLCDLRGMGEAAFLARRPTPLSRAVLNKALANFAGDGGEERFDILYLTAWAPDSDPRLSDQTSGVTVA